MLRQKPDLAEKHVLRSGRSSGRYIPPWLSPGASASTLPRGLQKRSRACFSSSLQKFPLILYNLTSNSLIAYS